MRPDFLLLLSLAACHPTVGEVGLVDPSSSADTDTDLDPDTEPDEGLCDDAELGCVLWTGPHLVDCYTERLENYASSSPGGDWIQSNSKCVWQGIEYYAIIGATVRDGRAEGMVQVLNYSTVELDEVSFDVPAPLAVGDRMVGQVDLDLPPFDHLEFEVVRVEEE